MDIVRRRRHMKEMAREARSRGKKIGFVPTMGYLHEGHLTLVRKAKELSDLVVVSLFVNPRQFGPKEDLERYPRDLARDTDLCAEEGVDVLFHPETSEMYPKAFRTFVEVEDLSRVMCGRARPGHFRGVTTVVLKLFHMVRPHYAFFGQKDAQQLIVIKRMVRDLDLDVEVVGCPTVRDEDGLAMSSRNRYLSAAEREAATVVHRALEAGKQAILEGERDGEAVDAVIRKTIETEPTARPDYVSVTDTVNLEPLGVLEGEVLIAAAVYIGNARLIDNIQLKVPTKE
jgi:pantoate--beta-alanine ligase